MRKKSKVNDSRLIIFNATFDNSSPHARVVSLEVGGGGKLVLSFPQSEIDKLIELQKQGMDKSFVVICDIDNVINVFELIKEKEKFLQEIKLESGAFREELQKLCPDVKVGDFSDEQVTALFYLGNVIEYKSDADVAGILNVPIAQIKRWRADIAFRRVYNALTEYNFNNNPADILKGIMRAATQSYGIQDRKLYAKMTGRLEENPSVNVDLNFFREIKDRTDDILTKRRKTLGFND